MRVNDWQGNEYGPGDTVLYPAMSGRSVTMVKAEVLDVYEVYRDDDTYKWERLDTLTPELQDVLREHDAGVDRAYDKEIHLRVQVRPIHSSRWEQHSGRDFYVDNRTGKRIDPWKSSKHWANADEAGDWCATTGVKLDSHGCAADGCRTGVGVQGWGSTSYYHGHDKRRSVLIEFRDYVERRHAETTKVTLHITENVTKVL